jgi:hypothetical protein
MRTSRRPGFTCTRPNKPASACEARSGCCKSAQPKAALDEIGDRLLLSERPLSVWSNSIQWCMRYSPESKGEDGGLRLVLQASFFQGFVSSAGANRKFVPLRRGPERHGSSQVRPQTEGAEGPGTAKITNSIRKPARR